MIVSSLRHRLRLLLIAAAIVFIGATAGVAYFYISDTVPDETTVKSSRDYPAAFHIQHFCSRCHAYPHAETLPRSEWKAEIEQAYKFFEQSKLKLDPPPMEQVIRYFETGAPSQLPMPVIERATTPVPVAFERREFASASPTRAPAISNVNLVHLFDERRLDLLACDMRSNSVMALRPYESAPTWQVLGNVPSPAHAEVVDLDADGVKDIIVAGLGSYAPTDERCGSVVWLRGERGGKFTPITLLDGVGRVADVQAGDFRGVGKLDLVVAVFGWRTTGEIIYLENQTTDWTKPKFVPRVLDDRHGAIHVAVGDINGDGRPDIVALISQEHETIVAFVNEGEGRFRKETIYAGPHPSYGSTGIQLVDLNGDGKLDVLYTNGDTIGEPHVLKPYHGIQWLENKGKFPFEHHAIAPMHGAHRAVAADFRGTGRLDIVAVSLLPAEAYPQRSDLHLDSVVYFEQTKPGQFVRHTLESITCDHATCVAGDIDGTGRIDFVTGNLASSPGAPAVTIWKNQTFSRGARTARDE